MINTNTVNFTTNHRWVAQIPLNILFPEESCLSLNLTQFDIPDLNAGTAEVSYIGYTIEQPTGIVNSETKEITFSFLMDENMDVYWYLNKWANIYTKYILDILNGKSETEIPLTERVPVVVYMLNAYKKPILKITYHDCWIKSLGDLDLGYQDDPEPVKNTFTIAYSRFSLDRVDN